MNGPYTLNLDCPEEKPILVNGHFMVSTGLDGQVTTRSLKLSDHVSGKPNHKREHALASSDSFGRGKPTFFHPVLLIFHMNDPKGCPD